MNATKYQQSLLNDTHDEVASIPIESAAALKMVPCNKPYSLLDPEVTWIRQEKLLSMDDLSTCIRQVSHPGIE